MYIKNNYKAGLTRMQIFWKYEQASTRVISASTLKLNRIIRYPHLNPQQLGRASDVYVIIIYYKVPAGSNS